MHPQELEQHQHTRTELWRAACHGELTVEELYRSLAQLRKVVGPSLYDRPPRAKFERR